MSELTDAWSELLDLLRTRAPISRDQIRPGGPEGPDLVERELGITLAPEVREWFTLHGGTGMDFDATFLPQAIPMSAEEAVRDSRMIHEIWREFDEQDGERRDQHQAGQVARTWLSEYVMVGSDGCGGGFFVDNRPGPANGCVRWWDKTESDDDYGDGPVAPSLSSLIRSVTASLRDGKLVFPNRGWLVPLRAIAQGGRIEWLDLRNEQP